MLTQEEVVKIAHLARISLSPEEVVKFQKDLSTVLDYVAELNQIDVEGVEEITQVTGLVNAQRPDVARESASREALLAQAPEMKDGFYKVKAIL